MSEWQRAVERFRLALLRLAVVVYYRPMGRIWPKR